MGSARRQKCLPRRAATLIELLVVISLMGMLITLLLPSLKRSMEMAASTICMHNLREIGQTLMVYRVENDGWLPVVDKNDTSGSIVSIEEPDPWFVKLFPTYLNDPLILTCPSDPYRFLMMKVARNVSGKELANKASYGINEFMMTAGGGFLAEVDRREPTRPHDTILLADMGPDDFVEAPRSSNVVAPLQTGPYRNGSLLAWDDGYDPFQNQKELPWITQRHRNGINVLTLAGGVRLARTSELGDRPLNRSYPIGAAGDCTFCKEFSVYHYSFAKDQLFWWTGAAPVE